jgi:hypothetical protein
MEFRNRDSYLNRPNCYLMNVKGARSYANMGSTDMSGGLGKDMAVSATCITSGKSLTCRNP